MKSLVSFLSLASCAYALWPQPVYISTGDTVLFVDENVQFHWYELGGESAGSVADQNSDQQSFVFTSNSNAHPHDKHNWRLKKRYTELKQYTELLHTDETGHGTQGRVSNDEIIEYAIITAWRTIITNSFYPWKFHPRAWDEPSPEGSACLSEITVRLLSTTEPHASTVDESYLLNVGEDGKATIAANSSIGIARGLTSFTQLFYKHSNRGDAYTPFAPVTLRDAPKFQHRGINLDVSRNWFPVSAIKRQINAIAYNKMNRLHLHVTDSQSWPLEIPALPELSAKGAYRPDLVYTPEDFKHIQRYAALHGVEVVTEIDMPGHTSSIHHSYPNLVAAFNRQPDWGTYCAEPPCGTLKLNSTDVYDFLETLFDDLLPRISPYSGFFHTGGDEVNKNSYNLDDTVRSNESDVLRPLMQKFIDRNHDQVRASGLTPMVWEEMLLDWNLTLGEDVIVQSWQSDEAVAKIVSKGHKALVGNYKFWVRKSPDGEAMIMKYFPAYRLSVSRLRQRPMA